MSSNGYVYLLRPDHPNALKTGTPGYIAEHRLVASELLGRPLKPNEVVHHRNGNTQDNHPDNLAVMTRGGHAALHHAGALNVNWTGGRKPLVCERCARSFLPKDRRNDYGARFCSRECFWQRNGSTK